MPMKTASQAVIKINSDNENHHLWNNRGIWWCHFTVHQNAQSKRMRFSLKTDDVLKARRLRDKIFNDLKKHQYIV